MAGSLKLTLMIHIEDSFYWRPSNTVGAKEDKYALAIGSLANVVGSQVGAHSVPRGAKLSLQVDRNYLDVNDPVTHYPPPTSLRAVLLNGGNFWCHTHSATGAHLQSVWMCVASAWAAEIGTADMSLATANTAGRSGGVDGTTDWVQVAASVGIRRFNSTTTNRYAATPESLRPYEMTSTDFLTGVYRHDAAPGPLNDAAPTTLRQRPFYISVSSAWDASAWDSGAAAHRPDLNTIYPHANFSGSAVMIPQPGRFELGAIADGRAPATLSVNSIGISDFNAALTEIWTAHQLRVTYQDSITNAWYIHIRPGSITTGNILTFGAWVDSINQIMDVFGGTPKGQWSNMNEIADYFTHATSRYY